MRVGLALFLGFAFACGEGASAEPPRVERASDYQSDELDETLRTAAEVVRTRGFTMEDGVWRGFLVDHGTAVDEVSLRSGGCYVVVVVGSREVERIDLTVFDSDGSETARSEPESSAVRVCPPQSGTYFVALRSTGSGLFAARRFRGPAGLELRLDDLVVPR